MVGATACQLVLDGRRFRPRMVGRANRMRILLDRNKPVPLARQIQGHLERLMREGLLPSGAKLPATRELADELGVNRATVVLAYEELVAAGLARARVGQGTFVAERRAERSASEPASARRAATIEWSEIFSRTAQISGAGDERRRASAGPAPAGHGVISFAGGMPDSALFPTDAFRRALNEVIRREGEALLQYYPVA